LVGPVTTGQGSKSERSTARLGRPAAGLLYCDLPRATGPSRLLLRAAAPALTDPDHRASGHLNQSGCVRWGPRFATGSYFEKQEEPPNATSSRKGTPTIGDSSQCGSAREADRRGRPARFGASRRHRFDVSIVGNSDGNGRSSVGVRLKCSWPVTGRVAVAVCDEVGRCTTSGADEPSNLMATTSPVISKTMASVAPRIRVRRRRARRVLRRSFAGCLR
jgi:hypothetical protein